MYSSFLKSLRALLFALTCFITSSAAYAQTEDTICLGKDRLGRIANELEYLRNRSALATELDSSLDYCHQLNHNLQEQIAAKDSQFNLCAMALQLQEQKVQAWQTTAEEYKRSYDEVAPKLARVRKSRRGWVVAGCILGATTIIEGGIIFLLAK